MLLQGASPWVPFHATLSWLVLCASLLSCAHAFSVLALRPLLCSRPVVSQLLCCLLTLCFYASLQPSRECCVSHTLGRLGLEAVDRDPALVTIPFLFLAPLGAHLSHVSC